MSSFAPEQVPSLSQQALVLARAANDPRALFDALYLNVRYDRHPSRSATRLAYIDELLRLAAAGSEPEHAPEILAFRMLERLERGEIDEGWADHQVSWTSTLDFHQPFYEYTTIASKAMWALLTGRFAEAEQLAEQGLRVGKQLQVENVEGVFGIQMFTIRREQGRLADLAPVVRRFVAQQGDRDIWRPGLALIYSELGWRAEARQEFDRLASRNFASLPQDDLWATSLVYLAEVCADLGDGERASVLYDHLRPYAERNIFTGFHSPCLGSASYYLGLLASARSRWAEAELHLQEALEMNTRMGAVTWLARTQHHYGALLVARGRAIDREYARELLHQALATADRLGMLSLAEQVRACLAL
jgi:tetratricopeptide (TPR) repeat protein